MLCVTVLFFKTFFYKEERKLRLVLNALDSPFSHLHAQQKETKKEILKKGINYLFLLSCYYLFLKRKLDLKRNTST